MENRGKEAEHFYLVKASCLPEIFHKVIAVKERLQSGQAKTIREACRNLQLSRSAYYKYHDSVMPFYDHSQSKILTLFILAEDYPGLLSHLLDVLASAGINILTINQNYPINGLADISMVLDTAQMTADWEELMTTLDEIEGVREHRLLARSE